MKLFENQEPKSFEDWPYSEILKKIAEATEDEPQRSKGLFVHCLRSFDLYPPPNISKYLKRANIPDTSDEAIAGDWRRVFGYLYLSYLRQAVEVRQKGE